MSNSRAQDSSDEEEVFAFDDDEDDDDKEDEGDQGDQGDAPTTSWGRKKSAYYAGNRLKTMDDADLEEEEAQLLQAKLIKQLDQSDFGLDAFKSNRSLALKSKDELAVADRLAESHLDDEGVQRVIKNLTSMSKKEKIDFLKQESPELFELARDFNAKV